MPFDLIDNILPAFEIHLIGGPSGAGKTTWAMQTFVLDWQHGHDILGFPSHPVPWMYISSDRSTASFERTLERLKIPQNQLRYASAVNAEVYDITKVIQMARFISPPAEMIFIDGFLNMLPPNVHPNDNKSVSKWLATVTKTCQRESITIIGVLHSPKMKSGEYYDNPRQRISGGASWAGFADTVILVEPLTPQDQETSHHRHLTVCSRNWPEIHRDLIFNRHGRLVEQDDDLTATLFDAYLQSLKLDSILTTESVRIILDCPPHTARHQLQKAVENGRLDRIDKGKYRVIKAFNVPMGAQ